MTTSAPVVPRGAPLTPQRGSSRTAAGGVGPQGAAARAAERQRAASAAPQAPTTTPALGTERDNAAAAETSRHRLLDALRSRTTLRGVRACGCKATTTPALVRSQGRAWLAGVLRCGLVHACPVCGPRIRAERARDVEAALAAHRARGGDVLLLTLTAPHRPGDRLADLLGALRAAHSKLWTTRRVRQHRDALGWVGLIRSWEITTGASGWHPHVHALLLVDRVEDWQAAAFRAVIAETWRSVVVRAGLDAPGEHGCDVRRVTADDDETLAGYVLKPGGGFGAAAELVHADAKRGRAGRLSIGELLRAVADRNDDATRLWREYEAATKGLRLVQWSPGLRDRLGLADETPDAAVLDEPPPWDMDAAEGDDQADDLEDDDEPLATIADDEPPGIDVVLRLSERAVRALAARRLTGAALHLAAALPDVDDAREALVGLVAWALREGPRPDALRHVPMELMEGRGDPNFRYRTTL